MVAYVFDRIIAQGARAGQIPARTRDARNWFRNKAKGTGVSPNRLLSGPDAVSGIEPGQMYLFNYDPKFKQELPYYDNFPLVFPIDTVSRGFIGLNMHYLPLRQRAVLMDALYDTVTDQRYDQGTKLKLSYSILKRASKFNGFKPTIKKYLNSQVKSRFLKIESVEWDIALFLPLQRFRKASSGTVYRDSLEKMR